MTVQRSADWVPATIHWGGAGPLVQWCHLGDQRLTDPFFEQTAERAMRHPFNLLFSHRTPLSALDAEKPHPDLNLAGLIFHMSRCGSTVVSQMLSALACNVVLSEPAPLDQIVRAAAWQPDTPQDRIVTLMRGMVAALGRKRHAAERDLFIKLDAWHVLLLPLFRQAFPDVPWIFIYRQPLEVLASVIRERPAQMFPNWIPAPLLTDAPTELPTLSLDEYSVHVLASYLRAALAHHADGGLLVEYGALAQAACTTIPEHFGLRYGDAELSAMRDAALRDAKRPTVRFRPDGAAKREEASVEMRDLCETRLAPLYAQLEALRLAAR